MTGILAAMLANAQPITVDWTEATSGTGLDIEYVLWTGSQFLAVGEGGNVLISSNGISWTIYTSGSATLYSVAWSGSLYVAVGLSGAVFTSSDGTSWASQTSGTTNTLRGVDWDGSKFLAVGDAGTVITSTDGISWTAQTSGVSTQLTDCVWTGTQFIAVGSSGTIITSPNGATWTTRTSGAAVLLYSVAWSPALSLAVVGAGAGVLTSADGISWSAASVPSAAYTAVGAAPSGTAKIIAATSDEFAEITTNGTAWTQSRITLTTAVLPRGVAVSPTVSVIVGWNGKIFYQ